MMTIANQVDAAEYARLTQQQKPRKYRNVPVELDGIRFDSQVEAARYGELRLLELAGQIRNLRVHERWPLEVAGMVVAYYESDFDYIEILPGNLWRSVVEDVKAPPVRRGGRTVYSGRTAVYRLKRKMFAAMYGWPITEVER